MTLLKPSDPPRPTKIFALVKFFTELEHAQLFLNGDLYMRRLSHFRREEDADGRWDATEGVWAWLQKHGLHIQMDVPEIGGISITERDLAAPVSISLNELDDLYIYCMYAYYIQEPLPGDDLRDIYGEERLADLEAALQVNPRCLRFGPHAVVVPWAPFIDRMKQAARSQSLRLHANLVTYYDDEVFNGEFKVRDIPFRKQKRFAYQREFRICVRTFDRSPVPRTFNIGSLREVGVYVPSEYLLKAFKLSLTENARLGS